MAFLQLCLWSSVFTVGQSFSSNISKSKTSAISMSTVTSTSKPMHNFWNRIMFTIGMNKRVRTDEELKRGIANFYDESSQVWLDVWVSQFINIYDCKICHSCWRALIGLISANSVNGSSERKEEELPTPKKINMNI